MSRYILVDRGSGSRAGQLLRHRDDPYRWLIRVNLGKDATGKRRTISKVIHGTRRVAEAALIEMLQRKGDGRLVPRSSVTLAQAVEDWQKRKAKQVRPRTMQDYEERLRTYVLPVLGHRRLADLRLWDINNLYGDMEAGTLPDACRDAGWKGGPLSARSVRITHTALTQTLAYAVKNGLIAYNPAGEAELPTDDDKERPALTLEERERFIQASSDAFYNVLYRVLMDTGLRPGEAMALTWDDIDFERGSISVTKAVTKDSDGQRIVSQPKTRRARRTVPLFGLGPLLLAHREQQAELGHDAAGTVFTTQDGRVMAPWTFGRGELQRVLKAAGIKKRITLYSFRHTFASLTLANGSSVPLTTVSRWLGHSTIKLTSDTYQHLTDDVSDGWADSHTEFLAGTDGTRDLEASMTN